MGADEIYANGSRKAQVKAARGFVFAPGFAAQFCNRFLEFQRISMDRNLQIADGVTTGQVADGVAGQEEDRSGFTGCLAQLTQCVLLVGREPLFQEIDVVGHSVPHFRRFIPAKCLMLNLLRPKSAG